MNPREITLGESYSTGGGRVYTRVASLSQKGSSTDRPARTAGDLRWAWQKELEPIRDHNTELLGLPAKKSGLTIGDLNNETVGKCVDNLGNLFVSELTVYECDYNGAA